MPHEMLLMLTVSVFVLHRYRHQYLMATRPFNELRTLASGYRIASPSLPHRSPLIRSYASSSSSQSWDVEPVDLSYDVVEPPKPDFGARGQSLVICHGLLCALYSIWSTDTAVELMMVVGPNRIGGLWPRCLHNAWACQYTLLSVNLDPLVSLLLQNREGVLNEIIGPA